MDSAVVAVAMFVDSAVVVSAAVIAVVGAEAFVVLPVVARIAAVFVSRFLFKVLYCCLVRGFKLQIIFLSSGLPLLLFSLRR